MRWFHGFVHRLNAVFNRSRIERELDEELRFHLEQDAAKYVQMGMSLQEARRRARLRFGGVENVKEQTRDQRGVRWFDDLMQDIRVGMRGARKSPGFSVAVITSLAIGVGGATAIFSAVYGVLVRPLPYPEADQLYSLRIDWRDHESALSIADFVPLRERSDRLGAIGGYSIQMGGFALSTGGDPRVIPGAWVTHNLMAVLGSSPILGRAFTDDDEPAVLISHRLWTTHFGADPAAVGRTLQLDGRDYVVVGIMPDEFALPGVGDADVWVPLQLPQPVHRGPFYLNGIAKLSSGVTESQAHSELASVEQSVREQYAEGSSEWRYRLHPLKEDMVGSVRTTILLLFAAVGLVLLIAIANVANLLLARGTNREREVAVRAALGAGRGRLVRQHLTESALLGVLGGGLGVALAYAAVALLSARAAAVVPRMDEVSIDGAVLGFALIVSVASGLASGSIPAFQVPWRRMGESLPRGGRIEAGNISRGRARSALVILEFALAFTVLVGAGLLVRTLVRLERAELGIDPRGVLTFRLALPADPYGDPERLGGFVDALEERLRGLPGVTDVGFSMSLPPNRLIMTNNYTVEEQHSESQQSLPVAEWLQVSEGFFETLSIPVRRGRGFDRRDRDGQPGVVVVNQAFVHQHFPDQNPIGKRLKGGDFYPHTPWLEIVGVVADVPYSSGAVGGISPTVYTAYRQNRWWRRPYITVRASRDVTQLVSDVRREVFALDARLPLRDVATMDALVRETNATARMRSLLFSVLGGVAALIATIGVYGILSYTVNLRRRETAVRRAIGAPPRRLIGNVAQHGLGLVAIGIALGGLAAFASTHTLRSLLYEVSPTDPIAFAASAALLVIIAVLACLVPGMRAARADPMLVLREE